MNNITKEAIESWQAPEVGGSIVHGSQLYQEFLKLRQKPREEMEGFPASAWPVFNQAFGGARPGEFIVLTADTGCLAGETTVSLNRGGKGFSTTLERLVESFNGGKSENRLGAKYWDLSIPTLIQSHDGNGNWRLARIVRAMKTGRKKTLSLTTESGRKLSSSEDHKIFTENGWKAACDVTAKDRVMAKSPPTPQGRVKKKRYLYLTHLWGHPYAIGTKVKHSSHRVATHRVRMEAHINDLSLEDFVNAVRNKQTEGLKFIDPKIWAVHHKDHKHRNNNIENLELVTHKEHNKQHAQEEDAWKRVGLTKLIGERMSSMRSGGRQETYDLTVNETSNYLANGIVTHNSGKTTFALNWILDGLRKERSAFLVSLEMPWGDMAQKLAKMIGGKDPLTFEPHEVGAFGEVIQNLPLWYLDVNGPQSASFIQKAMLYAGMEKGCKFMVIDHFDYLFRELRPNEPMSYSIGDTLRKMIGVARRVNATVLLIVHPSKLNDKGLKRREIGMDEMKGSASFKQEADAVLSLFRPHPDSNETILRFQKIRCDRFGRFNGAFVRFRFDLASLAFCETSCQPEWGNP